MASGASKLIPSDPEKVMVIRNLTSTVKICSVPFLRFGRVKIGGRGTIVQLASGNLAVFSPVALTETVKKELAGFGNGQVKYITALDQEHHIFLEPWHKAFPDARVIGPETLPGYRDKQNYGKIPQANWVLFKKGDMSTWRVSEEFDREFDAEYVSAHPNQELVFNHKPSRTLIEADLLFNLPATEQHSKAGVSATSGILTRLACAINNTKGSATWQKRFLWYALSAGDRPGFNKSAGRIAQWDFDRIVPCHGDVVEKDGKGIFEKVFGYHLDALRKGQCKCVGLMMLKVALILDHAYTYYPTNS
ncbi:hypothetical protein LTR91_000570 [Friedmanniomyces endolithicus]|uniref:Uncharacterized protein n=1 Tax=Friedmanniomyces endolithicus TaxID=329885 RepID=A0AAN6FBP3_9PEZI|nr:hypothetical protein LTS00_010597 [Friedmanniomyces endolithicus]KAK0311103.1 hypothetical protein LTR82_014396 [Friedmanniomyces endolithicus]KAK0833026.1 hypothetical protein LTR73_002114 [Friedmanniomyces endolithicus]KAK0988470.1 hypothetical protein LTR54_012815 [Friedmanniomyces endolithicus]KAK1015545.1 hypothetical protein LTR91_000570 [Friedmanniomyces endolithicus]